MKQPSNHPSRDIRLVSKQISSRLDRFEEDIARYSGAQDAQHLTRELVARLKGHIAELDTCIAEGPDARVPEEANTDSTSLEGSPPPRMNGAEYAQSSG
jgi:hypothetical protein